jgi:hypothetical protein
MTVAPRASRAARSERQLTKILQHLGFAAERVPLSGSVGASFIGDITVLLLGEFVDIDGLTRVTARSLRKLVGEPKQTEI